MDKGQNLFYRWQVLESISEYLTLKDLLNTATLSKEYNQMLRKYFKRQYSLPNSTNQSQFKQLKELLNRKISIYTKDGKYSKAHPTNISLRNISAQNEYTLIETLDNQKRLAKTSQILKGENLQSVALPQAQIIRIASTNDLICYGQESIIRYRCVDGTISFQNPEVLKLDVQVEEIIVGFKHNIALVRSSPDNLKFRIFDNAEPLQKFKDTELPFQLFSFDAENNLAIGKNVAYFIFNESLYELNLKSASISLHPEFSGKKIVKIKGGRLHFIAYERVQELSIHWSTEDVVKFALNEGFQDFIKIFKTQKVTGKILLQMDKKYRDEVLGINNVKIQQKLQLKINEYNTENPQNYVVYGWGRASEGALGTNPSKQITKPIKIKLPNDCQIFDLTGFYTIIFNKKLGTTYINVIDEKTNKQDWKQISSKKIWKASAVDDGLVLIVSASKEKVPQRESQSHVNEKKQKLRTAKNIIDKINWDPNLNAEEFRVGFLDKFEGILEMPFKQLEDSQTKQYRIEYFKKGKQVVWDKKKRIDIL